MGFQWRGPVPQSNYTVGRDGNVVALIEQDGRIARLVSEDDTAYHAGRFAVNPRSIGTPNADVSGPDVETGHAFKG